MLVQGDLGLEAAARVAAKTTGRAIRGIIGPLEQVRRVRSALELDAEPVARNLEDRLFVLELDQLRVPALLESPDISFRAPAESEVEMLAGWRAEYHVEVLGAVRTPELEQRTLQEMNGWFVGNCWVLARHGVPISFTAFNAQARGIVQVGGVYTPPELRRNGYARAAVAGSLLLARERGAKRSTLFTEFDNIGAIRAYTALGYEPRGDFGLLFFR